MSDRGSEVWCSGGFLPWASCRWVELSWHFHQASSWTEVMASLTQAPRLPATVAAEGAGLATHPSVPLMSLASRVGHAAERGMQIQDAAVGCTPDNRNAEEATEGHRLRARPPAETGPGIVDSVCSLRSCPLRDSRKVEQMSAHLLRDPCGVLRSVAT